MLPVTTWFLVHSSPSAYKYDRRAVRVHISNLCRKNWRIRSSPSPENGSLDCSAVCCRRRLQPLTITTIRRPPKHFPTVHNFGFPTKFKSRPHVHAFSSPIVQVATEAVFLDRRCTICMDGPLPPSVNFPAEQKLFRLWERTFGKSPNFFNPSSCKGRGERRIEGCNFSFLFWAEQPPSNRKMVLLIEGNGQFFSEGKGFLACTKVMRKKGGLLCMYSAVKFGLFKKILCKLLRPLSRLDAFFFSLFFPSAWLV